MDNITTKRCTKCGVEYPRTTEFWHKNPDISDGFCNSCKTCRNDLSRQKRHEAGAKDRRLVVIDGKRQCTKCREFYPETSAFFSNDASASKGLSRTCKSCALLRVAKYNELHPEVHYKASKKYRLVHADKVKHAARVRRRIKYANDAEYRERVKQRKRDHDKTTKGRTDGLIQENKRRARLLKQEYTLSKQEWETCLSYWGYKCAICGKSQSFWDIIAMDHWIPVSKGGGTIATNCIPLCHSRRDGYGGCNNNKKNRDPLEWLIDKLGKRKSKQKLVEIEAYFEWVRNRDK